MTHITCACIRIHERKDSKSAIVFPVSVITRFSDCRNMRDVSLVRNSDGEATPWRTRVTIFSLQVWRLKRLEALKASGDLKFRLWSILDVAALAASRFSHRSFL